MVMIVCLRSLGRGRHQADCALPVRVQGGQRGFAGAARPGFPVRLYQLEKRLLAVAQHANIDDAGGKRMLGERGAMLAAENDQHVREPGLDVPRQLPHERPEADEHAGEPHDVGLRGIFASTSSFVRPWIIKSWRSGDLVIRSSASPQASMTRYSKPFSFSIAAM